MPSHLHNYLWTRTVIFCTKALDLSVQFPIHHENLVEQTCRRPPPPTHTHHHHHEHLSLTRYRYKNIVEDVQPVATPGIHLLHYWVIGVGQLQTVQAFIGSQEHVLNCTVKRNDSSEGNQYYTVIHHSSLRFALFTYPHHCWLGVLLLSICLHYFVPHAGA